MHLAAVRTRLYWAMLWHQVGDVYTVLHGIARSLWVVAFMIAPLILPVLSEL